VVVVTVIAAVSCRYPCHCRNSVLSLVS
jgi:hypothetical protein